MIKAVLTALPTFYMSIFRIPVSVAQFIKAKMRNFLSEGIYDDVGSRLLPWNVVGSPNNKGGLEIGNILARNKSLVAKLAMEIS